MCARLKTQIVLLTSVLLTAGISTTAQNIQDLEGPKSTKENSPYSRYGIGDLSDNLHTSLRGMGGTATGSIDPYSVNTFNPASYSFLKATTLEFAFEGRNRSIVMDNNASSSGTATFSYLTLGIPLGKYAGMSLGIQPESSIYYNANDTQDVAGLGKSVFNYNGSGSMQLAYLGLSGAYKGFSIGVNVGYMFGNSRYSSSLQHIDTGMAANAEFTKVQSIGGIYWKGGAMYQAKFTKDRYLNLGVTAALSQQLNTHRDAYALAYQFVNSGANMLQDTLSSSVEEGLKGIVTMPATYSFGAHYGKSLYWDAGIDFRYADWSKFSYFGDRSGIADNAYRFGIGGEITPDPTATKQYFSLVQYRLGFYYGKDYLRINNTDINYMGGTVGASFPLRKSNTQFGRLNTSLDIGKRGTTQSNLASEFYVRFNVGLSLNDFWFIKRKYD